MDVKQKIDSEARYVPTVRYYLDSLGRDMDRLLDVRQNVLDTLKAVEHMDDPNSVASLRAMAEEVERAIYTLQLAKYSLKSLADRTGA